MTARRQELALALLLALATALLFGRSIAYGFLTYDDPTYVAANPHVLGGLSLSSFRWAFTTNHAQLWAPLTWLSLMLDVTLFGPKAACMHFTNVALHAGNAALAFLALDRLTKRTARARCFVAAALFALHPIRVESVAWITERKDVLAVTFALITVLAYADWTERRDASTTTTETPARVRFVSALVIAAYALSLLAKPMAVTLPAGLLLIDAWPLARLGRSRFRAELGPRILEKAPLFALAFASSLVTLLSHQGALLPVTANVRATNSLWASARYLTHTLLPFDLSIIYPFPGVGLEPRVPLAWVLLSALLVVALFLVAYLFRAKQPYLAFGTAWFYGMLAPTILVTPGTGAMADRFTYLPSLGLFVAIVWLAADLVHASRAPAFVLPVLSLVLLTACAARTFDELGNYRDSRTLFTHAIAVTGPYNAMAEAELALDATARGDTSDAIVHSRRASELAPGTVVLAGAYASALEANHESEAAVDVLEAMLQKAPGDARIETLLGISLTSLGRYPEAVHAYSQAIEHNPEEPFPYERMAALFRATGRPDLAEPLERGVQAVRAQRKRSDD